MCVFVVKFLQIYLFNRVYIFAADDQRRDKSVRFADIDVTSGRNVQCHNAEQSHDIVMYYAYCAMKYVMDVLTFCADASNWEMLGTLKIRQSSVGSVTGCANSAPDHPNKRFNENKHGNIPTGEAKY